MSRIAAFAAGAALVGGGAACSGDNKTGDSGTGGEMSSRTGGANGAGGTGGAGAAVPDAGAGGGAAKDAGSGAEHPTPVPIYAAAVALPRNIG